GRSVLRALTRRSGKVSLLSRSTDGRLDESKYYREILRPLGLTDELRILLRHGPRTWGLLVLCRDAHTRPFSAAELAVAEAVSVPACAALRRSLEPAELTALVLDVCGLSPRAREIAQHVLLGRSTSEIAGHLGVSEYTVQDHVKQVFGKVGVRSRRELVAELFFRHYLPQLAHPSLSTDGRLPSPEHDG
ncbi:LuxR C-terminal-related transcriptional regulator, partial [Streptomyces olivochromogenes]|uniref:helix-turn-helix transcriptional regulator n=1 Tax=Streptomyces olivochromogenes TaxID=1963 RepID=UPI0036DC6A26